jgi:hypothetical protein
MTTYRSPTLEVSVAMVQSLVAGAGYVHPLFNPVPGSASPDEPGAVPLPGAAVLLLAGGLAEQSGVLDDAQALLEFREVSFSRMFRAPGTLTVEIEQQSELTTSSGRLIRDYTWRAVDQDENQVMVATARMLMRDPITPT